MRDHGQALTGGIANAGAVARLGDLVVRPTGAHTEAVQRHLHVLRAAGFHGAPEPRGVGPDGRERLVFVPGDVALPPYPDWAQTDDALASVARLLRALHDAALPGGAPAGRWSRDMADPHGGPIVCHNDVCLENVIFRHGQAVALIDFDLAAPGRPLWDLAQLARMCVPLDDEVTAAHRGWRTVEAPARLRLVCDAYGVRTDERGLVIGVIDESIVRATAFIHDRVAAGDAAFADALRRLGGEARFQRRDDWWRRVRDACARALS